MTYRVVTTKPAAKQLAKIAPRDQKRVREAIKALASDPRPANCIAMQGRDGYRIRVGAYRVLYEVADEVRIVTVVKIGHRREVYR